MNLVVNHMEGGVANRYKQTKLKPDPMIVCGRLKFQMVSRYFRTLLLKSGDPYDLESIRALPLLICNLLNLVLTIDEGSTECVLLKATLGNVLNFTDGISATTGTIDRLTANEIAAIVLDIPCVSKSRNEILTTCTRVTFLVLWLQGHGGHNAVCALSAEGARSEAHVHGGSTSCGDREVESNDSAREARMEEEGPTQGQ